MISQKAR